MAWTEVLVIAQYIIGTTLVLGPIILVASFAIGLLGFNPERAQAIRSAEATSQVVIEEIRHIHIRRPEKFRHDRLDRHPMYLGIHVAAFSYAICVFSGAKVTSNISDLSPQTKFALAACFIIGSSLVLTGATMGSKIGPFKILKGIHENMTSSMLADDIRLPYTFAAIGMVSVGISMAIYASTSFSSTTGSLGGWVTFTSAITCAILFYQFLTRIRSYSKARDTLIAQAISQIERGHVGE
jgi:hypothetical protein